MWKTVVWILFTCCCVKYSFGDDDFSFDSELDCTETLKKTMGKINIQKSNFSSGEYIWCIEPNKTDIHLFFENLFLHEDDELNIYGSRIDAESDTNPLIEPIHAQNSSFAVITVEQSLYLKLKVNHSAERRFSAVYHSADCTFAVPPDVHLLQSPIFAKNNRSSSSVDCSFVFNNDVHSRTKHYFSLLHFDFLHSELHLDGFSLSGVYKHNPLVDFFRTQNVGKMQITMPFLSNDSFSMEIDLVDSSCSGFESVGVAPSSFKSPPYVLNNGSIDYDCRWIFESVDGASVLGIDFDTVALSSPLDIVAVTNGASKMSSPLLHITSSSDNNTLRQSVRSSGKYLWVAFKPVSYASNLIFNVTQHGQGGHFIDNGTIGMKATTGNDTIFLLEVEDGKVVYLNFSSSEFASPAALSLYDGFNQDSHLLATLQGNVWYPVVSLGNKLKIIATSFEKGEFIATFNGVVPDSCMHMSNSYSEDYMLSGHCNETCTWTIPPQNLPGKELLLNLQYVSLGKDDLIEIIQLDKQMTKLGEVSSAMNHVPKLSLPANIGAVVKITRGPCTEEKLVLVGHSSYVPGCNQLLSVKAGSLFHVTSPFYPDTYPIGITCTWTIESEPKTFLNLAFDKLQLVSNHCVQVTYSGKKNYTFSGSDLPPDMLIPEKAVIKFLSSNCTSDKIGKELATSEGFLLNGTVADCGGNLDGPNGEFNTSLSGSQSLCIWRVNVQPTSDTTSDDVNIISYSVSRKDSSENFELHVYDGDSVRNREIVNNTNSDIWSRTNSLVFEYKRINISKPAAVLVFKFKLISCNSSMQCTNKLCMHPDWRCDGKNDCGDFSDELNCKPAPINPKVEMGYSSSTFFGTLFTMLIVGVAFGIGGHIVLQKYRNGQYRRFDDISAIG